MTTSCYDCCRKHLATALGWLNEYESDSDKYAANLWCSVGELVLAEIEIRKAEPDYAVFIRAERLRLMEDEDVNIYNLVEKCCELYSTSQSLSPRGIIPASKTLS